MDHHCIWINQCVGSHNHRSFFLFIANLTAASFIIVIAGFNTFYNHIYISTAAKTYCTASLVMAPLQGYICSFDGFARNSIIFCYLLSILLFILVGILTSWNCYLISRGVTYIDYLVLF
uniref:Palmitoyltransferase n=1 Tax=Heterorhabditis bacteriophora TaxID=37862 RepID=A0A1I7WHM3_HETBA